MRAVRVLPDGSWDYVSIERATDAHVLAEAMLQGAGPVGLGRWDVAADHMLDVICSTSRPGEKPVILAMWDDEASCWASLEEAAYPDLAYLENDLDRHAAALHRTLSVPGAVEPAETYFGADTVRQATAIADGAVLEELEREGRPWYDDGMDLRAPASAGEADAPRRPVRGGSAPKPAPEGEAAEAPSPKADSRAFKSAAQAERDGRKAAKTELSR